MSLPLWIGCAVWAYKGWIGDFYPDKTRQDEMLRLYVERLSAVEGNTTFYAMPSAQNIQRWKEAMPPHFRFCPKLFRGITHDGLLMPHVSTARTFLLTMLPLEEHLGPTLMQLPPSYGPAHFDDLRRFIAWWPHDRTPLCLEVRHPGWWVPEVEERLNALLTEYCVARVLLDTRAMYDGEDDPQALSERQKPEVPVSPVITAGHTMIRFIAHPDPERIGGYLDQWAEQIAHWLAHDVDVYYFSHCPQEEHSPAFARLLYQRLDAMGLDLPPFGWDHVKTPPKQLGLF